MTPFDVMPLYLRQPLAEITRERVQAMLEQQAAATPKPEWRQGGNGHGHGGNGHGQH